MLRISLALLSSLVVAILAVPEVRKVVIKNNVFDVPGGRKIHTDLIPSMGGVGIFLGFLISSYLWTSGEQVFDLKYLFVGMFMIFFMGLRDDMMPLNPKNKLFVQIVAATLVVVMGNVQLTSLYTLFPGIEFPQAISYALTIFVIVALTNSFNLIDGINGLAGGVAAFITMTLGIWFYLIGNLAIATLMISMFGACIGFLYYNWGKASIFMGDTGSLFLGFFIATSLVMFINTDYALAASHPFKIDNPISVAILLFGYPFIDTLRIFTIRIMGGRSPFSPDKKHIHHVFVRTGFTHSKTSAIVVTATAIALFLTLGLGTVLNDGIILGIMIVSFYFIPIALKIRVKRFKMKRAFNVIEMATVSNRFNGKFTVEKIRANS
ncbi:glycosyltransferase family 4 protein [Flammeovirga agarivorans]|uniref:Undecaprenyl/decaprenyl-phosphate alpha-N-acetylglucosaminyl 1-phosphate transferase n=1 Tax=Flammeovirga agarivorans TaxID=2726742 RepID=A0A7X8SPD0_9BACT|nr:MraY family glycosyltransferase [Flammeovirga agarivorans]NLR93929.1 undecaprenyl/decaprenyl-phosphate alpha-N-acetylglucosaminyl 1-phosphate transferase [Flammeovirga agarivorans]